MYGLNHRLADNPLTAITPVGQPATVMVIDPDPIMLSLVREAVAGHHRIVVVADGAEALSAVATERPDALVFDLGLGEAEVAMITVALAACDELEVPPTVTLDPAQPMNLIGLRKRIDEAIRVSRRVYLGGGLRHRMAA